MRLVACFAVFGLMALLVLPKSLHAAQAAKAETDTNVYETPGKDGKIVDQLKKGNVLEASNLTTNGFYKVRTSRGVIGWVSQEDLKVELTGDQYRVKLSEQAMNAKPKQQTSHSEEEGPKKEFNFKLGIFGDYNLFSASGIINSLGKFGPGFGFGAEVGIFLSPSVALLLRGEQVFKGQYLTDTNANVTVKVTAQSYPIMTGLQFRLLHSQDFSLFFTALGGYALNTGVSSSGSSSVSATNLQNLSSGALTGLGKIDLYWHFSKRFSLFGECGYRYLKSSTFTPNVAGGSIFASSFQVDLSGIVAGFGLAFAF